MLKNASPLKKIFQPSECDVSPKEGSESWFAGNRSWTNHPEFTGTNCLGKKG